MATAITTPETYEAMRGYLRNGELARRKGWPATMLVKDAEQGNKGGRVIHATGLPYQFTQEDKDAVDWLIYRKGTGNGAY